jgi:hypothetical protein
MVIIMNEYSQALDKMMAENGCISITWIRRKFMVTFAKATEIFDDYLLQKTCDEMYIPSELSDKQNPHDENIR